MVSKLKNASETFFNEKLALPVWLHLVTREKDSVSHMGIFANLCESVYLMFMRGLVCTVSNTHSFRLVGAFKTKKQPQKRVFREKLALVVSSGHKPTQTRLVQLHIVSCENVQKSRADQQNLAFRSTFLDGQTLLKVHSAQSVSKS